MKIEEINRSVLPILKKDINAAMEQIAEKYGLKYVPSAGSFNHEKFTSKFDLQVVSDEGVSMSAKGDFERFAQLFDLEPSMFGQYYMEGQRSYTICGLNTRAPKNCVKLERDDGVQFKCSAEMIIDLHKKNRLLDKK